MSIPMTIKPLDDSERCPRCGKYGADGHTLACDYLEADSEPRYDPDAPSVNEQAQRSYYDKYYGS